MARRALALADVLREELQWIRPGSPEQAAERWTAEDWSFVARDVYEPLTFPAKIERTRAATDVGKDRYAVLVDQGVASADFHVVSAGDAATRIAKALSDLVRDDTLCTKLIAYRDFREIVDATPTASPPRPPARGPGLPRRPPRARQPDSRGDRRARDHVSGTLRHRRVPLFLLVLFVESTLLVGMSTLVSTELEREW